MSVSVSIVVEPPRRTMSGYVRVQHEILSVMRTACDVQTIVWRRPEQLHEAFISSYFRMPVSVARSAKHRIVHLTNQTMAHAVPLLRGHCVIVTCHDIYSWIARAYPKLGPLFQFASSLSIRAMRRANAIVTVSDYSAREIASRFPRLGRKLYVIPNGVNHAKFRPVRNSRAKLPLRLTDGTPLLLSVGSDAPRKGQFYLMQALALLAQRGVEFRWVRIGCTEWNTGLDRLDERTLRGRVIDVGEVSEDSLPVWYSAADAFIFPSMHEGFGLPPLEAMACGTPVVASRRGAIPEVLSDAALYVDPERPADIADVLEELLADEALRTDLRGRGLLRARGYSWTKTVELLLGLYEQLGV